MMLPDKQTRLFCEHKNIITYNVSISNKIFNINRLDGYTPQKPRDKKPYSFLI